MATVRLSEESAPQFTRGPWTLKVHTGDGVEIRAADDWSIYGADGESVCYEGAPNPRAAHNARAITALPALYDALAWIRENSAADSVHYQVADAALSSARGEQGK